ncbi:uncharacterized protein L201_003934 [Kwoniella dendrophila CBS 6074]|uniref:3',5'-cyclic-nucleotide phosphodiesterase n=1 Tax=Kwoniella dendrophila CBS 6074 TaxID=1295534 RepID=A0AAX4JUX9_9TREE
MSDEVDSKTAGSSSASASETRRSTRSRPTKNTSSQPRQTAKVSSQKREEGEIRTSKVTGVKEKEESQHRTKQLSKTRQESDQDEPTFEIIVLGSGGGPLETDCSGYLVKATKSSWEDGILAVEGGSGLGALASILSDPQTSASTIFPDLKFPPNHNTPLLQASHIFSFLACYLITHAHLDHVGSLIMLSGSVPARAVEHHQAPTTSISPSKTMNQHTNKQPDHPRPHVYGTRITLEQLSQAYQGGLWPELGSWVPNREGEDKQNHNNSRKKRKVEGKGKIGGEDNLVNSPDGTVQGTEENYNSCLIFSPLSTERVHRPLHPTLPISLLTYPIAHGCTTKHTYESSAMFIRYDPSALTETPPSSRSSTSTSRKTNGHVRPGREFLFFGDVESSFRKKGEEHIDTARAKEAKELNETVWKEASTSWKQGRLCGIFLECSYDSSRPAHLMFGHLSPPGLYYELQTLAGLVSKSEKRPLDGLKVFIIHIKASLVPHPTGKTTREIIMSELKDLEKEGQLGVEFIETNRGDRIGTLLQVPVKASTKRLILTFASGYISDIKFEAQVYTNGDLGHK